jgi:glycosyltransferase involved in cell wall biosynthesis
MKILSLSCVFPNPSEPGLGLFVRARLLRMSASAQIKVIAPVPLLDYSQDPKHIVRLDSIPARRQDGALEIFHPRWLYPPFGGPWNPLFLFGRLAPAVRRLRGRFRFDLIDAHFAHPDGIAAAYLSRAVGVPFVVTLRGNETAHARHAMRRLLMQRALCRAARVICVSESLRRFAIGLGVDPAKTRTIPNGIDAALFHRRDPVASRRKHGIAEDAKVVLSAGALIERKGHHRTIQALHQIPGVQLLIAGAPGREGKFEEEIRSTVSRLGMESRVRFLGQVSPSVLPELMSAADLFCLASNREGWPNVVHEAMGCGTPVVATNVGGVADMVPSESYGFVVPVNDPAALREALDKALSRTWDHDAISAWAASRSWENVAREVVEEFAAVLGRSGPGCDS